MASHPEKRPPIRFQSESQNLEEQIRLRAYQLYEARGREDGHELEDWLCAEDEIMNKTAPTIAA